MSKRCVRLKIDGALLKSVLQEHETLSERAQKYGVTKQAISGWIHEGKIPPRALCEIAIDFNLSAEILEEILQPSFQEQREKKKRTLLITIEEQE